MVCGNTGHLYKAEATLHLKQVFSEMTEILRSKLISTFVGCSPLTFNDTLQVSAVWVIIHRAISL